MDQAFSTRQDETPDGPDLVELAIVVVVAVLAVLFLVSTLLRSDRTLTPDSGTAAPIPPVSQSEEPRQVDPAGATDDLPSVRLLPAASCRVSGAGAVTCRNPAPNIETVLLRDYPSRSDLYDAYVATVRDLGGGRLRTNVGDCSGEQAEGEVSWSLDRNKSREYGLGKLRRGTVDPLNEAAGRVFCTESGGVATLVWTQDAHRLGIVSGRPATRVAKWWVEAHVQLACAADPRTCPL